MVGDRYKPPYTPSGRMLSLVEQIGEVLGLLRAKQSRVTPHLRRGNRIRSVQGSLAVECNPFVEFMLTLDRDALLELFATEQEREQLTEQVSRLLPVTGNAPMSAKKIMAGPRTHRRQ